MEVDLENVFIPFLALPMKFHKNMNYIIMQCVLHGIVLSTIHSVFPVYWNYSIHNSDRVRTENIKIISV